MSRVIHDDDLLLWEAYASSGENGFPARAQIVFLCLSDRQRRPRTAVRENALAEVEREVEQASVAELQELLREAHDVS